MALEYENNSNSLAQLRTQFVSSFTPEAYGADPTGVVDSTAAIQAMFNAIAAAPTGKKLATFRGTYLLTSNTTGGGLSWCLSLVADDVTLYGPGAIIRNTTVASSTLFLGGCGKPEGPVLWLKYAPWRYAGDTLANGTPINPVSPRAFLPMNPASRGGMNVTLTVPANAGTLVAGDTVIIRAGQVTTDATTWNAEPDSEYNIVKTVNAGTGVVTFERPLAKDYAAENQSAIGQTSSTGANTVAVPLGIAKITEATQHNVAIIGLRFESTGTNAPILIRGVIDGLLERDLQIDTTSMGHDAMEYRNAKFQNLYVTMRGTGGVSSTDRWPLTVATGCTDISIENLTAIATDVTAVLHIHEGSARVRARRVSLMSGPGATTSNEISIRARAYDVEIDDYYISGGGTPGAIFIGADCSGGGRIGNGVIHKPNMTGRAVLAQVKNWNITPPADGIGGDIQVDPSVFSLGLSLPVRILSGWVSHNQTTTTLGVLPSDSVIISAGVYVYTAFDSSGTDLLNIGSPGNPTDTVSGIDVSVAFNRTVAVGAAMGFRDIGTTMQASYVAGGTAPTVGRALAWVVIATVPAQPVS